MTRDACIFHKIDRDVGEAHALWIWDNQKLNQMGAALKKKKGRLGKGGTNNSLMYRGLWRRRASVL